MDRFRIGTILFVHAIFAFILNSSYSLTNQSNETTRLIVNTSPAPYNVSATSNVDHTNIFHNVTSISTSTSTTPTSTDRPAFNFTIDSPLNVTTTQQSIILSTINRESHKCNCDLTSQSCDVNCCCDSDCSDFDLEAFVDCVDISTDLRSVAYDPRYCFKDNFIVLNNTHYKFVQTSDDLLCIYTDNFKQRFEYKEPQVLSSAAKFAEFVKKHAHHSWPKITDARLTPEFISGNVYKVGSPLYIKYPNGQIGHMVLPRGSPMATCNGNNPMSFLKPETFTCQQWLTDISHDCQNNVWFKASTYFKDFLVAQTPSSFNNKRNASENGENGSFLEVTPLLCSSNLLDNPTSKSCSSKVDIPEPRYNETEGICYNTVSSVAYLIEHNGTRGLTSVEVRLTVSPALNAMARRLSQTFAVNFEWASRSNSGNENETTKNGEAPAGFIRSGNPGYRIGSPVIVGKLVTRYLDQDNRDEDNGGADDDDKNSETKKLKTKKAIEVSLDPSKWLTVAAPSDISLCSEERLPVRFGRNLKSECQLMITFAANASMVDACQTIQKSAMKTLEGYWSTTAEIMVAAYGNANIENLDEWISILTENRPRVEKQMAIPLYRSSSLSPGASVDLGSGCTNVVRELEIHVVYANVGHFNNPQSKIIGVRFHYGLAERMELLLRDFSDDEVVKQAFALTTTVTFIDASMPAVTINAEPPAIDIHLPYDFFYPFHESAGAVQMQSINNHVKIILTICAWLLVQYYQN